MDIYVITEITLKEPICECFFLEGFSLKYYGWYIQEGLNIFCKICNANFKVSKDKFLAKITIQKNDKSSFFKEKYKDRIQKIKDLREEEKNKKKAEEIEKQANYILTSEYKIDDPPEVEIK